MKCWTILIVVFFLAVAAYPQTPPDDWSWTFQRGDETCGLLFEDTNLTASVKGAIREDVSWSYSFVAVSNLFTRLYISEDPEYGTFVGSDGTKGNNGGAEGLRSWRYKLHNGSRYFHVDKKLSAKFLQAIALTNQHQVAVGNLTNFLHAFNSTTVSNMVPSEYLQLWWSWKTGQPFTLSDFKTDAEFQKFVEPFLGFEILIPSILNFRYEDNTEDAGLRCKTVFRRRNDGYYREGLDIVYRNGGWRLVFPKF